MDCSILTEMRVCKSCGFPKSLLDFGADSHLKTGRKGSCLVCVNTYARKLYDSTRSKHRKKGHDSVLYFSQRVKAHKEFLNSLKDGKLCADCGSSFPPVCLDFDHVVSGKRYSLSQMSNHRRDLVLEELSRCELVCCVCHRVRTKERVTGTGIANKDMRKRREKFCSWMEELKSAPCTDCASSFPAVAMDFDHVLGEKVKGISAMWSWSREKVLLELGKCELVCANCHRLRTAGSVRLAA